MQPFFQGKFFVMGQLDGVRFLIAQIFGWCFLAGIASEIKRASNHNYSCQPFQDWPPRMLSVPVSIHEAWKKGGESRASLLKMFEEAKFDKDWGDDSIFSTTHLPQCLPSSCEVMSPSQVAVTQLKLRISIHQMCRPLPAQEAFVKLVEIKEKKEEQVQMKCWAGWASEDKMRDTLKIKELGS